MRPTYERDFDRNNEVYIKDCLEASGNFTYSKAESFSPMDGTLSRAGKPIAMVEIKTRTNASDKYPTYMISATKVKKILLMCKENKTIPMLVVRFTDGVFATELKDGYAISKGGRKDRNDSCDIESCVYIPMKEFRKINS